MWRLWVFCGGGTKWKNWIYISNIFILLHKIQVKIVIELNSKAKTYRTHSVVKNMFDTSKACNWNKLARLPKHAFLKDRYWKKMFLCILCCALHVNVHLWISVNTHAEDKELVSFSMALYLLSLKQSIIELEVQCFSQTDRSASSQDLPVFAHPTCNARVIHMCSHDRFKAF